MIKPFFHITPPKKVTTTSQLPFLYHQQRTLTAAKNVTEDSQVQKVLERKQSLMSQRIAKIQHEEDAK